LLSVTAIIALAQSTILAFIGVDTPHEWIVRNDFVKAREALGYIYQKESVEEILEEMIIASKLETARSQTLLELTDK
jgi:hypothetical protein